MKIELRKVKYHRDMSEETPCFSAEVWIDGEKRGTVRNQGTGGSDEVSPHSLYTDLHRFAATQLPRTFRSKDRSYSVPCSVDILLSEALEEALLLEDYRKALKTHVLFTKPNAAGVFQTSWRTLMKATPLRRSEAVEAVYRIYRKDGCRVLNEMPESQGFSIWKAAVGA